MINFCKEKVQTATLKDPVDKKTPMTLFNLYGEIPAYCAAALSIQRKEWQVSCK